MASVIKRELDDDDSFIFRQGEEIKRQRIENQSLSYDFANSRFQELLAIAAKVVGREANYGMVKIPYPPSCEAKVPLHKVRRLSFLNKERRRLSGEGKDVVDWDFLDDGLRLEWKLQSQTFQERLSRNEDELRPQTNPCPGPRSSVGAGSGAIPGLDIYNAIGLPAGTLSDPIVVPEDLNDSTASQTGISDTPIPLITERSSAANGTRSQVIPLETSVTVPTSSHKRIRSAVRGERFQKFLDKFESESSDSKSDSDDGNCGKQTSSFSASIKDDKNGLKATLKPKSTSVPPIAAHKSVSSGTCDRSFENHDMDQQVSDIDDSIGDAISVGMNESLHLDTESDGEDNAERTLPTVGNGNSGTSDFDEDELPDANSDDEPPAFGRLRRPDSTVKLAKSFKDIQLPVVPHGRPRRLLPASSPEKPMMTISMRGDTQFISTITKLSLPAEDESYRVEDAIRMGDRAILGHGVIGEGKHEIAIISSKSTESGRPMRTFIPKRAHGMQGISCINPFAHHDVGGSRETLEFLTGGNDKTLVLWRVRCSQNSRGEATYKTTTRPLTKTTLNSRAIALARHPNADVVHATAGRRLWSFNVETGKGSNVRFSNDILHLHTPSEKHPDLLLAEVDHMYAQMQLLDMRSPTSSKPVLEFGRAIPSFSSTSSPSQAKLWLSNSRKRRGCTSLHQFVRGYHDGRVLLWDYRSLRDSESSNGIVIGDCGQPVWHTVFGRRRSDVWSFAQGGVVTYFEV